MSAHTQTKILLIISAIIISTLTSGCASYLSAEYSKDEIAKGRIYASGDDRAIRAINMGVAPQSAIRAVKLDGDGVGIGLDVSNLQALGLHPFRQLGAAMLDAGLIYGAYLGVTSFNSGNQGDTEQNSGRDTTTVNVNGDGNTVSTGDKPVTTTSSE